MQHVVAIIPARLGSTRFPRKVLASATGKPLIQHVWERTKQAWSVQRVVVAADDRAVADVVQSFGGEIVMTAASHPNGTSRLAETAEKLRLADDVIVVNVQGDEPEVDPHVIDAAVAKLMESGAEVATVASPFQHGEDPSNPNIVKAVLGVSGFAMYFSRAPIPFAREGGTGEAAPLKHVGLYVYRAGFLKQYAAMASTPLERTEMLEQLRVLECGYRIAVAICDVSTTGIDTPEQYAAFVARTSSASG